MWTPRYGREKFLQIFFQLPTACRTRIRGEPAPCGPMEPRWGAMTDRAGEARSLRELQQGNQERRNAVRRQEILHKLDTPVGKTGRLYGQNKLRHSKAAKRSKRRLRRDKPRESIHRLKAKYRETMDIPG